MRVESLRDFSSVWDGPQSSSCQEVRSVKGGKVKFEFRQERITMFVLDSSDLTDKLS